MEKIKTFILFIISIIVGILFYLTILQPSYASYYIACNPNISEEKFPNYIILGKTISLINESNEREIKVEITDTGNEKQNRKILRHELVHVSQTKRGFPSLSCSNQIQKYLAEVEAYTLENLPDNIFYIFYDKLD